MTLSDHPGQNNRCYVQETNNCPPSDKEVYFLNNQQRLNQY